MEEGASADDDLLGASETAGDRHATVVDVADGHRPALDRVRLRDDVDEIPLVVAHHRRLGKQRDIALAAADPRIGEPAGTKSLIVWQSDAHRALAAGRL